MEYLNNTIVFLQEQNKQLRQKLRRAQDLQNIINQQRSQQQKEYLSRLHQQQIKVIREMGAQKQNQLRFQIKQLKAEIQQLTQNLINDEDIIINLKRELQRSKIQNEDLHQLNLKYQQSIESLELAVRSSSNEHAVQFKALESEYKCREEEVIRKYLEKLDEYTEKYEDQIILKQKNIQSQNKRIDHLCQEKQVLEEELQKLMAALRDGQAKTINKQIHKRQEIEALREENQQLRVNLKSVEISLFETQEMLKDTKKDKNHLEQEISILKKHIKELENTKKRELQRQKSKTISICRDLAQHKKYLKGQLQASKRKEKEFSHSKKLLINKIKEMESKPSSCKSNNTSFIDKTTAKTSKKHDLQCYQSISLDNSFNKDSPSVSCFLNQQKINLKAKKPLTIDTSSYHTLLRFENIDTPCFESAKQVTKKTIKIKK